MPRPDEFYDAEACRDYTRALEEMTAQDLPEDPADRVEAPDFKGEDDLEKDEPFADEVRRICKDRKTKKLAALRKSTRKLE